MRSWEALAGALEVRAEPVADGVRRIAVQVVNTTPWDGTDRQEALRRTFCSTHAVLRTTDGAFVSQTDPPERLRAAAAACRNDGAWPVLVDGDGGARLADHPRGQPADRA